MLSRLRSAVTGRFVSRGDRRLTVRERPREITAGFARALAGQVTVGLLPNEAGDQGEELRRAHAALTAIGIMLSNATDDPQTHAALETFGSVTTS